MVYTLFISSCSQICTLNVVPYATLDVRSVKNIVIVCNYDNDDESLAYTQVTDIYAKGNKISNLFMHFIMF